MRRVIIHLCGLPEGCPCGRTSSSRPLLDLASNGVYLAAEITSDAGALLPHRFTLTCALRPSAVFSLLHLSVRFPQPGFRQRFAL